MASLVQPAETGDTSEFDDVAAPDVFDRQAQRLLGISGDEFLRRWDAGEFRQEEDSPHGRATMFLAVLLPFGRRNP